MLIGYNKKGIIEFIFTDDAYLAKKYPDNSAKVTDFWGESGSHLKELFIEVPVDFNYKERKVIDGKLVKLDILLPETPKTKIIIEERTNVKDIKIESQEPNGQNQGQIKPHQYGG